MISGAYLKWFSKAFRKMISELERIDFNKDPEEVAREIIKKRKRFKVFRIIYRFEKFLHDFIGRVGKGGILIKRIDPKKLVPELITDVSDVLGMVDDISDLTFIVQFSILLSEFYFLLKAYEKFGLKIPEEVKRDFKNLVREAKVEGKITRAKEKGIFFETIEKEKFQRFFKMKKDEVKDLYIKLCNFVLRLYDEIRNIIK